MREWIVVVKVKGLELQFSVTRRIWKYDLYFSDEFTLCILFRSKREKINSRLKHEFYRGAQESDLLLKSYTLVKLPIASWLSIFTGANYLLKKEAFCWSVDEASNILRYWTVAILIDAHLLFCFSSSL